MLHRELLFDLCKTGALLVHKRAIYKLFLIILMRENGSNNFFKSTYVLPDDQIHIRLSSEFEKIVSFIVKLEVELWKIIQQ